MKHHIERTSPKGGPFVGTCRLCGKAGFAMSAVLEECENVRGLTVEEALSEMIVGDDRLPIASAPKADGWTVVDSGGHPEVNTVSDTRRAAIVNWLVTDGKTMILASDTDEQIEIRWAALRASHQVVPVIITPLLPPPPKEPRT